ncbi:hypothetical protein CKO45_28415 [Paracraurococcus ruber]|uniref:Uncharacterized protein n=2 Tax=Paracraurococcus ruber TaxID=77675 RepID=A0ABS1D5F8_9PROT|nr:hypothetical protein [Paracraurococcus ruber]
MPDICTPTLHDRALWSRVSQLPVLAPRSVRHATRAVALEGLAGRAAARAAEQAEQATRDACTHTHYHLLVELVRQSEPAGGPAQAARHPKEVEALARAVLLRRSANGALSPAAAFQALADLAEVLEPCGLPGDPTRARLPRLSAEIAAVIHDLSRWSELASPTERGCIRLLAEGAALTQRCFGLALQEVHGLMEDLWQLAERWRLMPEAIGEIAARPDWLLDGWEMICGLWRAAGDGERSAVLGDMAQLVPVMPVEVADWAGFDAPTIMETHRIGLRHWRRSVHANQDWMTGRILDSTARYEAMRARCA